MFTRITVPIESATYFFDRYGYEKISVDEIAGRIRKSKASVYNHFPVKLGIFRAVLEKEFGKMLLVFKRLEMQLFNSEDRGTMENACKAMLIPSSYKKIQKD